MRTVKRVLAWILVVLSVLGILAMLGSLVGSWVVRNEVTQMTVDLLTTAETAVATTNDTVNRIDARLDVSQNNISTLETNIINVGGDLAGTSLVGTVISNTISQETATAISEARATAVTIAETIKALDEAVQTANNIPFVNLDGFVPSLISDAANGLQELETDITTFRTGVQERREQRISTSVDFFTGLTSQMSGKIGNVQSNLNEMSSVLSKVSTGLAEAKVSLPRLFTTITLLVDVLLLLIALAFASLLGHSLVLARNPDLTLKELATGEKGLKVVEAVVVEEVVGEVVKEAEEVKEVEEVDGE